MAEGKTAYVIDHGFTFMLPVSAIGGTVSNEAVDAIIDRDTLELDEFEGPMDRLHLAMIFRHRLSLVESEGYLCLAFFDRVAFPYRYVTIVRTTHPYDDDDMKELVGRNLHGYVAGMTNEFVTLAFSQ